MGSSRSPAAQSCLIEGESGLFLGELPQRGAALLREKFLGGPPRGCLIEGEKGLFLGEPAARGCSIEGEVSGRAPAGLLD